MCGFERRTFCINPRKKISQTLCARSKKLIFEGVDKKNRKRTILVFIKTDILQQCGIPWRKSRQKIFFVFLDFWCLKPLKKTIFYISDVQGTICTHIANMLYMSYRSPNKWWYAYIYYDVSHITNNFSPFSYYLFVTFEGLHEWDKYVFIMGNLFWTNM